MSDTNGAPISPRGVLHRGGDVNPSVDALKHRFGDAIVRDEVVWGESTVVVQRDRVHDVVRWLHAEPTQRYDYLVDVTAVEYRERERPLEVVWHLRALEHRRFLRLKVELPKRGALAVPSIVDIYSGADWLERECYDMFGIEFTGHPDLRRILMWDSYREGFPLRKDFPLRGRFSRAEQLSQVLAANPEARYSMEELHIAETFDDLPADMRARLAAARPPRLGVEAEPVSARRTVDVALGTSGMNAAGRPIRAPHATAGGAPLSSETREPALESDHMLINIGPQHPATHGVLRLVLELDGETVVRCIPHIGYLHCGFEKMGEYRQYNQIIPWTDREDYLNSPGNNVAFSLGAERLFGVECTPRATVLRVILMELSRIMSHVVWLGTTSVDIGAFTPFLWLYQERENIYNLLEGWVGARLTTSATRVGGMAADLPNGWLDGLRAFLRAFPRTLDESVSMLETNGIWAGRTVGLGAISADEAVNAGLSGPMLRASGVAYDVRKDFPYLDYETYDFDVPVGSTGDVYDRFLVRVEEMRQSVRILEQAVIRLPEGPINIDDPRLILPPKHKSTSEMESMIHHFKLVMEGPKPPVGECYVAVESPKGEKGYYFVSDGSAKPARWRIRPPSFVNLSAIPRLVEGHLLSDVIAINASIDIVMGEIDR